MIVMFLFVVFFVLEIRGLDFGFVCCLKCCFLFLLLVEGVVKMGKLFEWDIVDVVISVEWGVRFSWGGLDVLIIVGNV